MAERFREALGIMQRIDVPVVALGGGVLIANFELEKQGFWYANVTKNAKRFSDSVLPLAVGIVGIITRQPLLQKMILIAGMLAIKDAYMEYMAKEPWVRANSGEELEIWNFDASSEVSVVIDGSPVSFTATPTTDSNGYAKVTLPSAMDSGLHRIVVYTAGGKAWAGFVVV